MLRIVIDLQAAQLHGHEDGRGRYMLELARALLRTPETHTIFLLLNGALPGAAALREQFANLLPAERIRLFHSVAGPDSLAHEERRQASELTRDFTIAQLRANAVVLDADAAGKSEGLVLPGRFAFASRIVALLDHHLAPDLELLRAAHLVLVMDAATHAVVSAELAPQRLLRLAPPRWDEAASSLLAALATASIADEPAPKPARARRRLAFVSPLPPERTGIADYAVQLLPAMLDDFEIELITQQQEAELPLALAALPRHPISWFADHAHEFDQILYQFGNSPYHSSMFALLREHPGVVVLHDFFLSNVLAYEQMTGGFPNGWNDALFHSHGFVGLKAGQIPGGHAATMDDFPCNLEVLEGATRIIVHSQHAQKLAREWYGEDAAHNWSVVPLPRAAPALQDRQAARFALGIASDVFLVCSFGYIGPTKLTDTLVRAWLSSGLQRDASCELVLVGANAAGEFGEGLIATIEDAGAECRIRITGWADEATYHLYLQAADVAVQLRSTSRGETSAAVLDAMNYGLATIVNANGSMAALPTDGVWMLPDRFELLALVEALETLRFDERRRGELAERARDVLRNQYRPDHCAALYREALDLAHAEAQVQRPTLLRALRNLPALRANDHALRTLAEGIARAPNPLAPRQILVDVSTIVQHDLRTGIERVVRTQLLELLQMRQHGLRVEPVYLSTEGNRWHYRYARRYALDLMGIAAPTLHDSPIDFQPGDVFYCADFAPAAIVEAARAGVYTELRTHGVSMNFLIYDLLPVLRPEFFPRTAEATHAAWLRCIATHADRLLSISRAVADEAREWLGRQPDLPQRALQFVPLHLGADIDNGAALVGGAAAANDMAATLAGRPSFLMVGTIEPRKGHLQSLAAFEELWNAGEQVNLVIVGNEGWKGLPESERRTIPEILRRLQNHPEAGNRLLWLRGVDDLLLETIYRNSTCLLAPSEGEGFGLPLIEAARYGLPVLARNIPVFREVAEEHALYFDGMSPSALADAVRHWLQLRAADQIPSSGAMRWHTWRQNAECLLKVLSNTAPDKGANGGLERDTDRAAA
ncbi:glycosyltransferase [Massilia sp. CMS3.1]|uniref:glycosyltransferase n=1 Tax=Massilia sp. CMS3.1 TaxID=3373083 RepID=UPI003EE6CA57